MKYMKHSESSRNLNCSNYLACGLAISLDNWAYRRVLIFLGIFFFAIALIFGERTHSTDPRHCSQISPGPILCRSVHMPLSLSKGLSTEPSVWASTCSRDMSNLAQFDHLRPMTGPHRTWSYLSQLIAQSTKHGNCLCHPLSSWQMKWLGELSSVARLESNLLWYR